MAAEDDQIAHNDKTAFTSETNFRLAPGAVIDIRPEDKV